MRCRIYIIIAAICLCYGFEDSKCHAQDREYLSNSYYGKHIVKVFKLIKDNKLLKAEETMIELSEKYDKERDKQKVIEYPYIYDSVSKLLDPVWQIAECLIYNNKNSTGEKISRQYNPWGAYLIYLNATKSDNENLLVIDFLKNKSIQMKLIDIKESIEANMVEMVRKENTEEKYDDLISTLRNYDDLWTLKKEREQLVYNNIVLTQKVEECQHYLDKYKEEDAIHYKYIESRRDSLAFVYMPQTVKGCKHYLSFYPSSRYIPQVDSLLYKYAFDELIHTVTACRAYLSEYPKSPYYDHVKMIEAKCAFDDANKKRSIDGYRQFIRQYDWSEYVDSATHSLESVILSKYFSKNTTINELRNYLSTINNSSLESDRRIMALYNNLLVMPTSSRMQGYKNFIGTIKITTTSPGNNQTEMVSINNWGLLSRRENTQNNNCDVFHYSFDDQYGFQLSSRENQTGKMTKYTSTYNDDGYISSFSGNDGSKLVYIYNNGQLEKIVLYKDGKVNKTDYYNRNLLLTKTETNGIVVTYNYNEKGDVELMEKQKGTAILSSTKYNYEYNDDENSSLWTEMTQYNDGTYLLTKYREVVNGSSEKERVAQDVERAQSHSENEDEIYQIVKEMPEFPGGEEKLLEYLGKNIHYPERARVQGAQGRCIIEFVINKDGSVVEPKVFGSLEAQCDNEAMRVIRSMPKWKPGKEKGELVRVKYTVPVQFKLT